MNQAIHSVDLLAWLMGPVEDISARTAMLAHERIEVEDVAVASLRFSNGDLGVIEATTAAFPGVLNGSKSTVPKGPPCWRKRTSEWEFATQNRSDVVLRERMADKNKTGGGAADLPPSDITVIGSNSKRATAIKTGTPP